MSTIGAIPARFAGRYPSGSAGTSLLRALWAGFLARRQLSRSRLHLLELTDDQLRDIGIARHVADQEAGRSLIVRYLDNARW